MVLDCCETMVGQLDFSSREEPDYACKCLIHDDKFCVIFDRGR